MVIVLTLMENKEGGLTPVVPSILLCQAPGPCNERPFRTSHPAFLLHQTHFASPNRGHTLLEPLTVATCSESQEIYI